MVILTVVIEWQKRQNTVVESEPASPPPAPPVPKPPSGTSIFQKLLAALTYALPIYLAALAFWGLTSLPRVYRTSYTIMVAVPEKPVEGKVLGTKTDYVNLVATLVLSKSFHQALGQNLPEFSVKSNVDSIKGELVHIDIETTNAYDSLTVAKTMIDHLPKQIASIIPQQLAEPVLIPVDQPRLPANSIGIPLKERLIASALALVVSAVPLIAWHRRRTGA